MSGIQQFFKVIKLLWDNRDQFERLLQALPAALCAAGQQIDHAGTFAINAAGTATNAGQVVGNAASALTQCYQRVNAVALEIRRAGEQIDAVRVPTVTPTTTTIGSVTVVTGLQYGNAALFGTVGTYMKQGATNLDNTATRLQQAANAIGNLGQVLNQAGQHLTTVGTDLRQSGQTIQGATCPQP